MEIIFEHYLCVAQWARLKENRQNRKINFVICEIYVLYLVEYTFLHYLAKILKYLGEIQDGDVSFNGISGDF